jgi:hypothetical protein
MTAWSDDDLHRIGDATELQLAARRADGALRSFTTMWVVRFGDDLYVRSASGPERPWYRHALATGKGRVKADGVERDVAFGKASAGAQAAIDDVYHDKYDRFGPDPVSHVTGPDAHRVTIRLTQNDS